MDDKTITPGMTWWGIAQVALLVFCWPIGLIMLVCTGVMAFCWWLDRN